MAALVAVENPGKVWSRVVKMLAGASPAAQEAFRALKTYLAQQGGNAFIQVVPFSAADAVVAATGSLLGTGTPKVYGIYAKKGTVATAAFLKVSDNATGVGTGAELKYGFPLLAAAAEAVYIDRNPTALASGLSVQCATSFTGATSSTGATTGCDGFIIYG